MVSRHAVMGLIALAMLGGLTPAAAVAQRPAAPAALQRRRAVQVRTLEARARHCPRTCRRPTAAGPAARR